MNAEFSKYAIYASDVKKSFGGEHILRGANLRVEPGKVAGLLGRSGEGKTTLIKILLDITAPDAGEAGAAGIAADGRGKVRLAAGYVPERPVFHSFMKAEDIFKFRAGLFPSWDEQKAQTLAKQLELSPNRAAASASKGELAKIAWICAAAHNPKVFIMDEPTSGLDALIREEVLARMIEELQSEGKSFLVASHRLEDMAALLDEIWLLSDGMTTRYDARELASRAKRVTGRLKAGVTMPEIKGLFKLQAEPPLGDFAAFDAKTLASLRDAGVFEDAREESLPFEKTLSLLLTLRGGEAV
jgi:ABC-2 type transport system ATP-binding protein